MKEKQFSKADIIKILSEQESGYQVNDICRRYEISIGTLYDWKSKYSGMKISEGQRLSEVEAENAQLKKLLGELMLKIEELENAYRKYRKI